MLQPAWQAGAGVKKKTGKDGRGVPDVSSVADPETGITVLVGGKVLGSAGTSACAPVWAALTARINQALGKNLGYLNPILYRDEVAATFRHVTEGNNHIPPDKGQYNASSGWNPCTGLGTPNGTELLEAVRNVLD